MKNDDPHIRVEGSLTNLLLAEFNKNRWEGTYPRLDCMATGTEKGEAEMRQGRQTAAYEEAPTIEDKKHRRQMSRPPSGS